MLNTDEKINEEGKKAENIETDNISEEEKTISFPDLLELLKTFLDSKGFNSILDKFPTKVQKLEIESQNKMKDFKYLKHRYIFDIVTIFIILGCITFLSCWGMIERATLGTLLGSVIGYALGRFKNRND